MNDIIRLMFRVCGLFWVLQVVVQAFGYNIDQFTATMACISSAFLMFRASMEGEQ